MKNNLVKNFLIACCLLISVVIYAQADSPENTSEDQPIELDDNTPIDNGILWLGIAGVAFGLYYYTSQRKKLVKK